MRSSHAAAVWIFERLGLDVALAGDLLKERARGRSSIWYWRQVAAGCAANAVWYFLWAKFQWLVLWYLGGTFYSAERLPEGTTEYWMFRRHLAWYLTPIATEVAGLLFGGIAGARPKRQSSAPAGTGIA